ncbi:predicted protein [Naegleria gruberi]|uniref:Predicted protein n=1 Tax=Naegleria gruberi TaxID=5762 RepID=D2W441_NAEGR|nr:uncharacterized protein NAEGRDRAFT_76171 [Naegleria gruberi]EFC36177.1 predicted protein [Naegleria gruberi]|eukprot:XP_002668921.1 predicted protein [Naegleria gruberi strain NEG-M]
MIYQEYLNDLENNLTNMENNEEEEIPSMEEYFSQIPSNEIKFKKPLKVKLIISDLNQPKLASKMASTVNSFVNVFSQFGWVHTAFSISNLKFDWVKSEYCETGDVKGTSCLLAITVKEIEYLNELENCLKIVCFFLI